MDLCPFPHRMFDCIVLVHAPYSAETSYTFSLLCILLSCLIDFISINRQTFRILRLFYTSGAHRNLCRQQCDCNTSIGLFLYRMKCNKLAKWCGASRDRHNNLSVYLFEFARPEIGNPFGRMRQNSLLNGHIYF